jgi:hypothetical protein
MDDALLMVLEMNETIWSVGYLVDPLLNQIESHFESSTLVRVQQRFHLKDSCSSDPSGVLSRTAMMRLRSA